MFNKFVREIFDEAELKKHGFIHKDKSIVRAPIGDFLERYTFQKSDSHFYVCLFVQPLYVPSPHVFLSFGWRLRGGDESGEMFFLDDQIQYSKEEVVRLIQESKDLVLAIDTPMDFYYTFHDRTAFGKKWRIDSLNVAESMA